MNCDLLCWVFSSRIRQYQHEDKWDKAVITCDIQMNQSTVIDQSDVLQVGLNFINQS